MLDDPPVLFPEPLVPELLPEPLVPELPPELDEAPDVPAEDDDPLLLPVEFDFSPLEDEPPPAAELSLLAAAEESPEVDSAFFGSLPLVLPRASLRYQPLPLNTTPTEP